MTSLDAVTSARMNKLPSYHTTGRAAKYPYGCPHHLQALFALPGQGYRGVILGGGGHGRNCAQAAQHDQPALHLRLCESLLPPYHPSPEFSLLLLLEEINSAAI